MRNTIMLAALGLAIVPAGACAPDDLTDAGLDAPQETAGTLDSARVAAFTSLGVLSAPGGGEVEFRELEDGTIIVAERVRTGQISPMDALMTAQNATPLELYMALAPGDRPAPMALERAHATYAVANRASAQPRHLGLQPAFTTQSGGTYSWKYAADCDLADDGGWFDHFWQTYGWRWHWYRRTSSYDGWSATTPKTIAVQTHLCNDGPSGDKIHRIRRSSCGSGSTWSYIFTDRVRPEYRSQFRVWNSPYACYYSHRSSNVIGSPYYPVYSFGITTT
jgi:hypothetical protein